MFVNHRLPLIAFALSGMMLACSAAGTASHPIRLRNETILPSTNSSRAQPAAALAASASGLHLVQFAAPPTADQRAQLHARGVDLLRYVPDNAFIARLDRVAPAALTAMPGATFVGAYTSAHKLHRDITAAVTRAGAFGSSIPVSVMFAPRAAPAEMARVGRLFQQVRQQSDLPDGGVVRGTLPLAQLKTLAASDAVLWIEAARPMKLMDEIATKIVAGDSGAAGSLAAVHQLGFTGSNVVVAVADSGLDSGVITNMHRDIAGRVGALFAYGGLPDAADEHSHGTHCAGIVAGNAANREADENGFFYGLGVAPGAQLIGQRMFDGAGAYYAPPSYGALTRDATRAGAVIGSNSWGDDTQGRYDNSAYEFDALVRDANSLLPGDQPYILEFSAGNAGPGPQTIGSPAVAKNVIATGACNSDRINLPMEEFPIYDTGPETMADFSSRGPCEDGRIKPDVTAPGTWIASLRSVYANDDNAWAPISDHYLYQGGTSQAGPHVAGAAAVFVQYWRATHTNATPSPALVKAALINSASDLDNAVETAPIPNLDEGWGRINLPALVGSPRQYECTDQSVLLTHGQQFEQRLVVASFDTPLKVTLTYSDVPGLPAAVPALVNDLDLEVEAPDGRVYRGNQFENGESIPDLPGGDSINNVEGVLLSNPLPGEYVIRVLARRVVQDARRDTAALDQDYALVISASVAASGVGILTLDRKVYRAPDVVKLSLVDYDLAGQPAVSIRLSSDTETGGEAILLRASGASGLFTGAVATAIGPAIADGKLQVNHDDLIEAAYQDAHPAGAELQRARADLRAPVMANVTATNRFGQTFISWDTDEPSSGAVIYGSNTLNLTVTSPTLEVSHEIVIPDALTNQVYRFAILATDEAGNRATNNHGGTNFTFVVTPTPGILLVDAFADFGFLGFILAYAPPLSGYTEALDAVGRSYDVFDATQGALPTLTQLRSYRCVIWRVSDLEAPSPTLAQRVQSYVNGGGSLLMASMEALSQFAGAGLAGFNSNVLQVASFTVDQPVDQVSGAPGDPVGAGIDVTLDYTPYDEILTLAGTTDASDWIVPTANATPMLVSGSSVVGVRSPKPGRDLPGRAVLLSFPLDAVPLGSGLGNNRAGLLNNVLNFLLPLPGRSTLALDSDVYTLPSRAVVEVEDAALAGQNQVSVRCTIPRETNALTVTLLRTSRPGQFRAAITLLPSDTGAPNSLPAQSGDTVRAVYLDATTGQTVAATATIDTNAPTITLVTAEPGYLEAVISWETSKPADSLVQYSESPLNFPNNFTAYDPAVDTLHAVLVQGLRPNQEYFFRVVSRDRAGNPTTDDNHGANYTFTTLQPLSTPWSDSLEATSADWSTYQVPDSETDWTLGTPGGGETAFSGTHCWGGNLTGGAISQTECYLISPGIHLSGGNRATLRFQHNYDFDPKTEYLDIEMGTVEILTDITQQPTPIAQFSGASGGWESAEVDLTPYVGKVVYLVWYYGLLAFDAVPRLGWLVDDVSVTVDYIAPGTIQITNNLSQAVFELRGPTGTNSVGRWTLLTNAVPGEYVLEFGEVPYCNTPPTQTNTLATGGTIRFVGTYTFTDANLNGLPDDWEIANFGVVSPLRGATTDTDHDGLSDYAEFVAGTDPNNPPPPFRLTAVLQTNRQVRLEWPSAPTLNYRVHASSDGRQWTPCSGWILAPATNTTFTLPLATNGSPQLFRVEATPRSTRLTANLRLTATRQAGGVRLDWSADASREYRVLGSSDGQTWNPVSEWNRTGTFTFGAPTQGGTSLFRVEVRP